MPPIGGRSTKTRLPGGRERSFFSVFPTFRNSRRIAILRRASVAEGPNRYERICRSRESDKGSGVAYELEYQIRDDFGGTRWVEDRGRWFGGPDGAPAFAVGVLRAIDERHKRESELVRLSTYDELTGLLNRVRLKEALTDAMIASQRGRQNSAFLLIAVDNLALINDAFGFDVADEVIVSVGERLRSLARRGDLLRALCGQQVRLVLHNCNEERLGGVCERLRRGARQGRDDGARTRGGYRVGRT